MGDFFGCDWGLICVLEWAGKGDSCEDKKWEIRLDLQRQLAGFGRKTGHFCRRGVRFLVAPDESKERWGFLCRLPSGGEDVGSGELGPKGPIPRAKGGPVGQNTGQRGRIWARDGPVGGGIEGGGVRT